MVQGYEALTEKEKQTLRLLLVGHDAKSMARHFDLSVHTINERLRDARRKLSVSSSKEAARLLREAEGGAPELMGDMPIGDVPQAFDDQQGLRSPASSHFPRWAVWAIGGIVMMSLAAVLLALSAPVQAPAGSPAAPASSPVVETEPAKAAREWLALVDAAKWQESWAGTGQSFRAANTVALWQSASEKAHAPLGRMITRTLLSDVDTPAPPNGSHTVQFRTDFANKRGVIETLSLIREGGSWKVVGIYIE
jgi:DNA-binding CsgD family transcriptional regulator